MDRTLAMMVKEIWAVLRDPKSRMVLVLPPLMQLFLFTYATTLDVKHIDIGVLNMSSGKFSTELIERLAGSPRFKQVMPLASPAQVQRAIELRQIVGAVVLDADFDARIARHDTATIGLVLDGRRSNAAQIVAGYVGGVAGTMGAMVAAPRAPPSDGSIVTNWYNPSLDYLWFTIPSLIAIVVMASSIAVTGQSVARERELGTFDQLMVSPLRVHEILIGKITPPILVGLMNGTIYLVLGQLLFGVPMTGSVLLFYIALLFFVLALIGVGMLISSVARTQQQAFLGTFMVMNPMIMLSGYSSPIDNMPHWLQIVTYLNPARYFMVMVQGLFLKAMPANLLWHQLWPVMMIGAVTLSASAWMFRARME